MTTTSISELAPCPFCGSALTLIKSMAMAISPPKLYHEYHHSRDVVCFIEAKIVWSGEAGSEYEAIFLALWNTRSIPTPDAAAVERAVMVCPQCDGEGGYPDGVDEAACHTDCTRCGSNGWIVDRAALTASIPSKETAR